LLRGTGVVVCPDDDAAFAEQASNLRARHAQIEQFRPAAVADGLQAVRRVRAAAEQWNLRPERIGILGFSASGAVAAGAATQYDDADSRPAFAAPIYAVWQGTTVPADVPPVFLAAATDDATVDVDHTLRLYAAWRAVGRPAEMHLYAQGGHGFGMLQKGLPSDHWIDRFWEWLQTL
jgi:acetyl esterase/lipase